MHDYVLPFWCGGESCRSSWKSGLPKAATTQSVWFKSRWSSTPSWQVGGHFEVEIVDERSGSATLRITGKNAAETFRNEAGGHRYQRVPPNEKKGRVHTSTITVAVMREPQPHEMQIEERDLRWTTCRGSGAGGQHRNMTDSAVQVKHEPSGLLVRCESERSQHQNKATALGILRARLLAAQESASVSAENQARRSMVGSGMRGDKIRSYRYQDDIVTDHRTGKKTSLTRIRAGFFEDLA